MCTRVTCANCGKLSWEGCGEHVEQALVGVAPSERCTCPRSEFRPATGRAQRAPLGGGSLGSW